MARGDSVIGIDSVNDYYDPRLKQDRLAELGSPPLLVEALSASAEVPGDTPAESLAGAPEPAQAAASATRSVAQATCEVRRISLSPSIRGP